MNERTIELDVSKEGNSACVRIAQGDVGGTTVRALVYDNGGAVDLSGANVSLVALLPDGRHYYRGACSVADGNEATYVVDEERLCSVAGYTDEAYLEIEVGGRKYSTERFAIDIVRSALDGKEPAKDWDNKVEDLIERVANADREFTESEEERRLAERGREDAEAARAEAESERSSAEASRDEAERGRQDSEQQRSIAEAARVEAEAASADAEAARVEAEAARADAEAARVEAEDLRVRDEELRAESQAKNNADQAANNAAAQGLQVVILSSGQYDAGTGEPIVSGEVGKLYFVPEPANPIGAHAASVEAGDAYIEWMWINSAWERVGMSEATIVPITTDEVDDVIDGNGGTGEQVLNLTGLGYLWTKIRTWVTGAFAALKHEHTAADLSGLAPSRAVVSDAAGHPVESSVTSTEIGFLSGLSAGVQDQIDGLRDSVSQGHVSTSGLYGGTTTDVEVSFPRAYAEPPTVVAGLASVSSSSTLGSISVAVAKVTETGCTLRFYNDSSTSRAPAANWVAMGRV